MFFKLPWTSRFRYPQGGALLLMICLWPGSRAFSQTDGGPIDQIAGGQSRTYPVRGTVVDSVTAQPIARVLVNGQQDAVLTDKEGKFDLQLPGGTAQILLERPGYGQPGLSAQHIVQVAPDMPALTFQLTPNAVISGQVTLPSADTADSIPILIYRKIVNNGHSQWTMQQMAMTNSEGVFRVSGLLPGPYLVYTQPQRDQEDNRSPALKSFGYPAVYYPGVVDPSAASVLTLTAGQHAHADLPLMRQPFYSVTVNINAQEFGRGLALQLCDAGGHMLGFPIRQNGRQGTAQFSVPDGSYFLQAMGGFQGANASQARTYGRIDFKVAGAPVTGLSITPLPLHPVPVNVRKDFTAVSATLQQSGLGEGGPALAAGLSMVLTPADDFSNPTGGGGNLQLQKGGSSFELDAVTPGRYWVTTFAFEGYVSAITSGGVDLAREPLVIGPGSTSPPIEITLRNDTGMIQVQLSDQAHTAAMYPASQPPGEQTQSYIYAIPLFPFSGQVMQAGASPSGEFTIGNLPPGTYRVVAFDAPEEIDFHSPESLAKYAGQGDTVTVEAGATANVQVHLGKSLNPDND